MLNSVISQMDKQFLSQSYTITNLEMDKLSAGPRVVRAPALRRGREITPLSERAKLERVLGLTVSSNAALDCDPQQSVVAYPAGCVVVLYNVRKNRQNHILSSSKKTITSLAFSWDGKYLATGECGHQPHLRVWDIQDCSQIAEFPGHKFGINCVAFSPNLKYVVSVGSQHDMIVNVWDWKNNIKVASNKVSCKVKALSFSAGGNYFVTVGNRHVKFWYLEYSRSTKYKLEPVPLMGRSAILGDQRNNYFCDVACGRGEMADSTYAITKSGLLCVFNSRRLLEKWVELKTTSANSICVAEDYIFIGCAEGIVRCFSPFSLQYISTLPKPHYLGVDVAKGVTGSHISSYPTGAKYPDTVAITFDETCRKVTCIYNDHSLYIWDIKDIKKVGKSHSSMFHSACIWGVETYPEISDKQRSVVPPGTFLTCSSDDTIRVWNMTPNLNHNSNFQKNIYSSDLLKVLYTDPELAYLCDVDFNPAGSNDKVDTTYDGKNGVRCLRISHDGRHLASGDRSGNVRICDLHTMEVLYKIEAHDSEVLCLEYSKPINGRRYLASASRDRLIHVFDVNQDYSFQQTLDDHSSSITAVRFVQNTSQLQMISCGADKSIIFRRAQFSPQLSFMREHHVVGRTTLYDMEVDSAQRHILTACQDRNIRVYSVNNVKNTRSFRGSQGEDGTLIKLVLDSTGTYLATSCTNKSLYIYDYYSGECVASMFGHSELVTGLKFTNDGNHLISVSGDGCIFVWKLPVEVTQAMLSRQTLSEATSLPSVWQDGRRSAVAITKPLQTLEKEAEKTEMNNNSLSPDAQENSKEGNTPGYRFSMGQLPFWAKKQMFENLSDNNRTTDQRTPPLLQPRGRWAQRLDGQGLIVKSYLNSDSVIPFPNIPNQQGDSNLSTIQFRHQKESLIQQKEQESSYEEFEISEESMHEIQTGNYQKQITGRTTLRQGRETQLTSPSGAKKDPRIRHPTDSSSASSLKLEDVEAEDERSDTEITEASEAVYYLPSGDNSEMGERSFHINTTTEEDLRESRRKQRGSSKLERLRDIPVASDYNELNSDDEDPATPVEENRSILHSLSFSTENLERLGKREKFMKSNYESLEKGPVDSQIKKVTDNNIGYMPRHSISAKFLARSLQTASVRPTSSETEKEKGSDNQKADSKPNKREELTRALNEARKKLETLGWKGGLSNSKSMGDLYNVTDSETTEKPKTESSVENSIRRTASISDLSTPSSTCRRLLPTTPTCKTLAGSQSSTAPLWAQAKTQLDDQTSSEMLTPWNNMSRSASMSSLQPRDDKGPSSGSILLKVPSIHTLAKVPGTPRRTGLGASPLSKAPSTSSVSALGRPGTILSTPRRLSLRSLEPLKLPPDSSSSDSSPTEPQSSHPVGRVVSMGRERGLSTTEFGKGKGYSNDPNKFLHNTLTSRKLLTSNDPSRSKSERDLSRLGKDSGYDTSSSTQAKVEPMMSVLPKVNDDDSVNINKISSEEMSSLSMEKGSITLFTKPSSVPLTQELCVKVAEELKRVTSYAIQIFQRVTVDTELPAAEKSTMTTTLAQGVLQAQQNLRPAVPPMPMWNPSGASLDTTNPFGNVKRMTMSSSNLSSDFVQHSMGKKLDPTSQPEMVNAMALLQQYSDRLLNLVEQRMNKGSGQEKSD
ncbi:mitogen-activated protein kinase-binding protein 1-like isoform X4 [Tachypleus tridentatus]|uniref:mitogen-activated protein kinase-binding protein 1-like isoform X4 n=1 Tax=Tachypleus tridentatus TaxID=6853 RepID=UPI003FD486F4